MPRARPVWRGSRILPLRVTTGLYGEVDPAHMRAAVQYAVDIAARDASVKHLIINISLNTDSLIGNPEYVAAVNAAYNAGGADRAIGG